MKPMAKMAAVAALMTGFLVYLVTAHALARVGGTEIAFIMTPQDPRDLLLGHYSIVQLDIHDLDADTLAGDDAFETGDPIHVALVVDESGAARPTAIHRERPSDGLFISGRVSHAYGEQINAVYGLERYYAPRDAAQALDDQLRSQADIRLIVSIADNGDPVIKGLSVDGESRYDSLLD